MHHSKAAPEAKVHLYRVASQFMSQVEIHWLPVYVPSEEEKKDRALYARNVQQVHFHSNPEFNVCRTTFNHLQLIAKEAGIIATDVSIQQKREILAKGGKKLK